MSGDDSLKRQYGLEIECLAFVGGGPDDVIYYSKGHHDPEKFVAVLENIFHYEASLSEVCWDYQRCEVQPRGNQYSYIRNTCEPGRGAYPVTAVYLI